MRRAAYLPLVLLTMLLVSSLPAHAGFFERLLSGRLGAVQDGIYMAGDIRRFEIQHSGKSYLLRFDGDPETFVLTSDHTSMGGRLLKYDTGEIALRVAGWGALTLYTDQEPKGLAAERMGDAPPFAPSPVSVQDVQFIAAQAAERIQRLRHLRLPFVVDWSVLATNADLRVMASEAMENAALGLERFTEEREARRLVARRIGKMTLATGRWPSLRLEQRTLIVTFNPEFGYAGCVSSRAVQRWLGTYLHTERVSGHSRR